MLPAWLRAHNLPVMDVVEAAQHPDVLASLERGIDRTNKKVSRAESIRKFSVINGDFSVENGLLTPSLKVKRDVVAKRFAQEIENLYS